MATDKELIESLMNTIRHFAIQHSELIDIIEKKNAEIKELGYRLKEYASTEES